MGQRVVTPSGANGWILARFAMGTVNYWFAFIADFTTALCFIVWDIAVRGYHPALASLAFFTGFILWGLTEYIFHRWVYHQAEGIFGEGHRIHHVKAEVLIAMPWFITTLTMFGLWQLCSRKLGIPYFSSLLAGWLIGFVWYSLVHHSHHHWNLRNVWIRKLKAFHRIHHQFPERNYGVTMRLWDTVFGTVYRKPVLGPDATRPVEPGPDELRSGVAGMSAAVESIPEIPARPVTESTPQPALSDA